MPLPFWLSWCVCSCICGDSKTFAGMSHPVDYCCEASAFRAANIAEEPKTSPSRRASPKECERISGSSSRHFRGGGSIEVQPASCGSLCTGGVDVPLALVELTPVTRKGISWISFGDHSIKLERYCWFVWPCGRTTRTDQGVVFCFQLAL